MDNLNIEIEMTKTNLEYLKGYEGNNPKLAIIEKKLQSLMEDYARLYPDRGIVSHEKFPSDDIV